MNGYVNGPWIEVHAEALKQLWADGLSCSQITDRLNRKFGTGYTRNAVIGKAFRLQLPGRLASHGQDPNTTTRRMRKRRAAVAKAKARVSKLSAIFEADGFVPSAEEVVIPPAERKTLQMLEPGDCRWPINDPAGPDFHFCARPKVSGLPYCGPHCRRAYQVPTPRRSPNVVQFATKEAADA